MSLSTVTETIMSSKISIFEKEYALLKDPKQQVDALSDFCWEYMDTMEYTDLCHQKALLAESILQSIDYPEGKIKSLLNFSYYHWAKSELDTSLNYSNRALELAHPLGYKMLEASSWQLRSISHIGKGSYDEAFKSVFEAIALIEHEPPSLSKGFIYYTLGILYVDTKDYEAALNYKKLSLAILQEANSVYGVARAYSGIGTIYSLQGRHGEAEQKFSEATDGFRQSGHRIGLSRLLNDMGVLYKRKKQYAEAEKYLKESYSIREALGHIQGMITSSYELGELLTETGDLVPATACLERALKMAKDSKSRAKEYAIHKALAQAYKQAGNMQEAYMHLEEFVNIQSVILGQETAQKLKQMETRMATERTAREAEIERLKNVELKSAHDAIALKNKDILDSITYAKRLQEALLPPVSDIKKHLPESFVLYKPKDIVAGDFYWAHESLDERSGNIYFLATADSTGHGVPGAFMSLLNTSILNEIVIEKKVTRPDLILNEARTSVIKALHSTETEDARDGMDCTLCAFDLENRNLQYAAANNSFYIIRDNTLLEQPADKMPVGIHHGKDKPFTLHTVDLQKGDMIYTLTDGYADQFGGPKGKKFKYKQLEKILLQNAGKPLQEQHAILEDTFIAWKGDYEQVDDMLIIGVRIL